MRDRSFINFINFALFINIFFYNANRKMFMRIFMPLQLSHKYYKCSLVDVEHHHRRPVISSNRCNTQNNYSIHERELQMNGTEISLWTLTDFISSQNVLFTQIWVCLNDIKKKCSNTKTSTRSLIKLADLWIFFSLIAFFAVPN